MSAPNAQAQTEQTPAGQKTPGIPSTSNAILALWGKAADHLTADELAWFSNLTVPAQMEAENLSQNLENMACIVNSNVFSESFYCAAGLSVLLFSLSHQLDVINGLLKVSAEAGERLELQASDQAEGAGEFND